MHLAITEARPKEDANSLAQMYGPARLRDMIDNTPPEPVRTGTVTQLPQRGRWCLQKFSEIKLGSEPADLIKGLLPRKGLTVIWGDKKSGKSFVVFDMAMQIARGGEAVAYVALEGAKGFERRTVAYRQDKLKDLTAKQIDEIPFYFMAGRVDLIKDHPTLIQFFRAQLGDVKPVAIVIDTLNRSLKGSESSDMDMSAYIAAADALGEAFDCLVIVIHHCGHSKDRPRGHTSLSAAADVQHAVRRSGNRITLEVEFMKDGPEGAVFAFDLREVEIGTDDDGNPITSCVLDPTDTPASLPTKPRELTARQSNGLRILRSLAATEPTPLSPSWALPHSIAAVRVDRWRDELFSKGVLDREAKDGGRKAYFDLRNQLQDKGLTAEREGMIWEVRA